MKFEIDTTNKTIKVIGSGTLKEFKSFIDALKDADSYAIIGKEESLSSINTRPIYPYNGNPIPCIIPSPKYGNNDSIEAQKYKVECSNSAGTTTFLNSTTGVTTLKGDERITFLDGAFIDSKNSKITSDN